MSVQYSKKAAEHLAAEQADEIAFQVARESLRKKIKSHKEWLTWMKFYQEAGDNEGNTEWKRGYYNLASTCRAAANSLYEQIKGQLDGTR